MSKQHAIFELQFVFSFPSSGLSLHWMIRLPLMNIEVKHYIIVSCVFWEQSILLTVVSGMIFKTDTSTETVQNVITDTKGKKFDCSHKQIKEATLCFILQISSFLLYLEKCLMCVYFPLLTLERCFYIAMFQRFI